MGLTRAAQAVDMPVAISFTVETDGRLPSGQTLADAIAQALLDRKLGPYRPVMILSGNSIDHALLTLGCLLAGVPVVPVAIRGTRSMLREGSWFPRRGRLRVTVCPPIFPTGDDWSAAVALRDAARAALRTQVGEPDLGERVSVLRTAGGQGS